MVIFVFGMPGSGKTIYIKEHFPDFEHIDIKRFQRSLPPGCTRERREQQMLAEYEECRQALVDALKTHENVVLEHTLHKAIRRTPYIDAVRNTTDQEIIAYVFDPDADSLLRMSGAQDDADVRKRIIYDKSILEIPTDSDGFAEIHIITEAELPDLSEYTYSEDDNRHHQRRNHAKTVIIPADVKELKHNFYDWGKVENFRVEAGNTHYADIDGVLFDVTKTVLIKYPEGRGGYDYINRSDHYVIPDGVVEIESQAFSDYMDMFARYSYPEWKAGDKSIHIPASVEKIGNMAFNSGTRRLEYIWVDEDNKNFASQNGVLYDKNFETLICCPAGGRPSGSITRIYEIPSTVKTIKRVGFSGCVPLGKVTLPPGLEHIEPHAFEECINLLEIDIPGTVKVISHFSFSYCFKLTNVILNEGTESIEAYAFGMCNFLKNILIPRSVKEIDPTAISPSPSLTIHCYEDSCAHVFANEHNISTSLIADTLPVFSVDDDAKPGMIRIEDESLNEKLMGNPEIAELLEKIADMAGPLIIE